MYFICSGHFLDFLECQFQDNLICSPTLTSRDGHVPLLSAKRMPHSSLWNKSPRGVSERARFNLPRSGSCYRKNSVLRDSSVQLPLYFLFLAAIKVIHTRHRFFKKTGSAFEQCICSSCVYFRAG